MNLTHCTLTGIDESTDINQLILLSNEHLVVEWGILYSPERQGLPGRYPSVTTLFHILNVLPKNVRVAVHLCGRGVSDFLTQESTIVEILNKLSERQGRVQLNFNYKRKPIDLKAMQNVIERYPNIMFITQYNNANQSVYLELNNCQNHAVLFDASGGKGLLTNEWTRPLTHITCGYAGGLGHENITQQISKIHDVVGSNPFWVDMEGKLRTTDDEGFDWFDLTKAAQCLERVGMMAI